MKKFTVSEDTEVVLNGKKFLLEKGDKITINEWGDRSEIFKNLLNKHKLPPPPGSEQYLDNKLWHHEYNRTWIGKDPSIEFDDRTYYPVIAVSIDHQQWMFVDGQWEKYDRHKKYTNKYDNDTRPLGGSSDLSRHLMANSPHGLSR